MKNYLENIQDTMIKCNRYAYKYGDGKAWDNRKKKTYNRYVPRGSVYMRLVSQEGQALLNKVESDLERLKSAID